MFLAISIILIMIATVALAVAKAREKAQRGRTNKTEQDWRLKEIWEDYPAPDYAGWHTYCSVAFDESGKTYYYRTRNPELKPGDMVYVSVGPNYEEKAGWVVEMKDYRGWSAPYPLEKTRHILDKVRYRRAG